MRRLTFSLVFLVGLTALEWMVLERLLYSDAESVAFVVESVRGVLSGTPVSKSWQHRFVAPTLVSLFGGARPEAVARFAAVGLYATNLLLFGLLWRRGVRHVSAIASVVGLGLAHFVLAYRLEYPWDVVDQLLFVAFGAWAARGGKLLPLAPLLLIATFNHETALYIPLWYLLSANRREQVTALGSAGVMAGLIAAARAAFYVGRPVLENQVFEPPVPLIENHLHVMHNVRALFVHNWIYGRWHLSMGFFAAFATLVWLALRPAMAESEKALTLASALTSAAHAEMRRAAWWSLTVLATFVCFGYVNETRHYLVLVAFWIPFAWSLISCFHDGPPDPSGRPDPSDPSGRPSRSFRHCLAGRSFRSSIQILPVVQILPTLPRGAMRRTEIRRTRRAEILPVVQILPTLPRGAMRRTEIRRTRRARSVRH